MRKSIVIVVRDIGAANMAGPLIPLLKNIASVIVVSEDKANIALEKKYGILPDFDASGSTISAYNIAKEVINMYKPDLVIVGIGSPIDLELEFLHVAHVLGIKTAALEDFHGSHYRLGSERPNMLLVVDSYAAMLSRRHTSSNGTCVVGNSAIATREPSPEAVKAMKRLRNRYGSRDGNGKVYAFSSGDTFSDLELVVRCMQVTRGCLVVRFHPKLWIRNINGTSETYGDRWRKALAPICNKVEYLPDISSEDVVALADGTLSGLSSLMYTAAWRKKLVCALVTDEVTGSLYRQTGLVSAPIRDLGVANTVDRPTDLATLPHLYEEDILFPYAPEKAFDALQLLL